MKIQKALTTKTLQFDRLMSMFAILMAINYPLYLIIWNFDRPGEYLGIELRAIATALCLILLFYKYWPSQVKKWLPFYWHGMVTFCLPFFFVFMTLKNHGSMLWVLNSMSAFFFTLIILDFFSALIVLVSGGILAWGVFAVLGNQFEFAAGTVTPLGMAATFFAAIIIGSVFTRTRGITEDERLQWEAEKLETELLRIENERQQSALQEKEKLVTLAHKVAHDISSPLSVLTMMMQMCNELPAEKRAMLKRVTQSILDIANNLLSTYRSDKKLGDADVEPREPLLVAELLTQLLSEKKVQHQQYSVRFEAEFKEATAYISVQKTELRRTISNLINNAVEALEGKEDGAVTLQLSADIDSVVVNVLD